MNVYIEKQSKEEKIKRIFDEFFLDLKKLGLSTLTSFKFDYSSIDACFSQPLDLSLPLFEEYLSQNNKLTKQLELVFERTYSYNNNLVKINNASSMESIMKYNTRNKDGFIVFILENKGRKEEPAKFYEDLLYGWGFEKDINELRIKEIFSKGKHTKERDSLYRKLHYEFSKYHETIEFKLREEINQIVDLTIQKLNNL